MILTKGSKYAILMYMIEKIPIIGRRKFEIKRTLPVNRFIGFSDSLAEEFSKIIEKIALPTNFTTFIHNGLTENGIDGMTIPDPEGNDQLEEFEIVTALEELGEEYSLLVHKALKNTNKKREKYNRRKAVLIERTKRKKNNKSKVNLIAYRSAQLKFKEAAEELVVAEKELKNREDVTNRLYHKINTLKTKEEALHSGYSGRIFLSRFLENDKNVRGKFFSYIIHEGFHNIDPFIMEDEKEGKRSAIYGGLKNLKYASDFTKAIAKQSLESEVFLNSYHKDLAEQWDSGAIPMTLFEEETFAILFWIFFQDIKKNSKLAQLSDAQFAKYEIPDNNLNESEFRSIVPQSKTEKPEGMYRIIIDLLQDPNIQTIENVDKYKLELARFIAPLYVAQLEEQEKKSRKLNKLQHK